MRKGEEENSKRRTIRKLHITPKRRTIRGDRKDLRGDLGRGVYEVIPYDKRLLR